MKASCHVTEIAEWENICFMTVVGHVYCSGGGLSSKAIWCGHLSLREKPSFCCNLLRVYVRSIYTKKRLPTCPLFINKGGEPFLQQSVDAKRATL